MDENEVPGAAAGAGASLELTTNGVGPWRGQVPDDERLDPELLAHGDARNVIDRFRYWRMEAIVAELDRARHPFHVAIENWQHDLNIGSIVRSANAFGAASVHIVGRRRWNKRGAMVTDRYQHVQHHETVTALAQWAAEAEVPLIAIDNVPGCVPLETFALPERCVLLFGQEGPGFRRRRSPPPTSCSRSRSSARRVRLMPRRPRRWPCTPGCCSMCVSESLK